MLWLFILLRAVVLYWQQRYALDSIYFLLILIWCAINNHPIAKRNLSHTVPRSLLCLKSPHKSYIAVSRAQVPYLNTEHPLLWICQTVFSLPFRCPGRICCILGFKNFEGRLDLPWMFPNPTILSWNSTECAVTQSMIISVVIISKNYLFSLTNLAEYILYFFLGGVLNITERSSEKNILWKVIRLIGENIKVLAHFSLVCHQVKVDLTGMYISFSLKITQWQMPVLLCRALKVWLSEWFMSFSMLIGPFKGTFPLLL